MKKVWLIRMSLVLGATVLTLGGLEILFRFIVPEPSNDLMYAPSDDPLLSVELPVSTSFQFSGLGVKIPTTTVTTNSLGFRGPELWEPAQKRLVCVGDSNTFGWGVEWEDTFCTRLATLLGVDWEPINLGVPGYNALQGVRRLELRGIPVYPDLVVFFFGSNDFDPPVDYGTPDTASGWLSEHSALARWVLFRLRRADAAHDDNAGPAAAPEGAHNTDRDADRDSEPGEGGPDGEHGDVEPGDVPESGEAMVVHALERLAAAGRAGGFHAVTFFNTSAKGKQGMLETLDNHGLFYDVFEDAFGDSALQIPGDGHYTAQGHDDIARRMATFIQARGLAAGSGRAPSAGPPDWEALYHPFIGYPLEHAPTAPAPGPAAPDMVAFPAGEALIGADDIPGALPQRLVQIAAFRLDPTEVTAHAYNQYAQTQGRPPLDAPGDQPAAGMDWYEADAFCRSLGKRLPTAVEWERAARGPDGRRYSFGPLFHPSAAVTVYRLSGTLRDEADWLRFRSRFNGEDPVPQPARPDQTPDHTPEDVVHLHGNVAEWVAGPVEAGPDEDLRTNRAFGRPGLRWVKGVGITSRDYAAPAAARFAFPATHRDIGLGFRCAASL